jgi:hypothetical protein
MMVIHLQRRAHASMTCMAGKPWAPLYCTYAPSSSQNKRYGQSKQRSRPGRQVQVHAPACALWIVGASRPNKSNWHMVTSGAADNSFRGATTTCLCTFRRPLARYYLCVVRAIFGGIYSHTFYLLCKSMARASDAIQATLEWQ